MYADVESRMGTTGFEIILRSVPHKWVEDDTGQVEDVVHHTIECYMVDVCKAATLGHFSIDSNMGDENTVPIQVAALIQLETTIPAFDAHPVTCTEPIKTCHFSKVTFAEDGHTWTRAIEVLMHDMPVDWDEDQRLHTGSMIAQRYLEQEKQVYNKPVIAPEQERMEMEAGATV